jgi:hypothetical protein
MRSRLWDCKRSIFEAALDRKNAKGVSCTKQATPQAN